MKKLLSILAAVTISATASSTIISCGSKTKASKTAIDSNGLQQKFEDISSSKESWMMKDEEIIAALNQVEWDGVTKIQAVKEEKENSQETRTFKITVEIDSKNYTIDKNTFEIVVGKDNRKIIHTESLISKVEQYNNLKINVSSEDEVVKTLKYIIEEDLGDNQDLVNISLELNSLEIVVKDENKELLTSPVNIKEDFLSNKTIKNQNYSVATTQDTVYLNENHELASTSDSDLSLIKSEIVYQIGFNEDGKVAKMPFSILKISNHLPPQITSLDDMFKGALNFNQDLSEWKVSNVKSLNSTFENATKFNGDLASFDNLISTKKTFAGATSFNSESLKTWKTNKVMDMSEMFLNAESFNQDLSSWNVEQIEYPNFLNFSTGAKSWIEAKPNFKERLDLSKVLVGYKIDKIDTDSTDEEILDSISNYIKENNGCDVKANDDIVISSRGNSKIGEYSSITISGAENSKLVFGSKTITLNPLGKVDIASLLEKNQSIISTKTTDEQIITIINMNIKTGQKVTKEDLSISRQIEELGKEGKIEINSSPSSSLIENSWSKTYPSIKIDLNEALKNYSAKENDTKSDILNYLKDTYPELENIDDLELSKLNFNIVKPSYEGQWGYTETYADQDSKYFINSSKNDIRAKTRDLKDLFEDFPINNYKFESITKTTLSNWLYETKRINITERYINLQHNLPPSMPVENSPSLYSSSITITSTNSEYYTGSCSLHAKTNIKVLENVFNMTIEKNPVFSLDPENAFRSVIRNLNWNYYNFDEFERTWTRDENLSSDLSYTPITIKLTAKSTSKMYEGTANFKVNIYNKKSIEWTDLSSEIIELINNDHSKKWKKSNWSKVNVENYFKEMLNNNTTLKNKFHIKKFVGLNFKKDLDNGDLFSYNSTKFEINEVVFEMESSFQYITFYGQFNKKYHWYDWDTTSTFYSPFSFDVKINGRQR
ncbi:hypothetical protein MENTO_v1c03350 [Mesoplasma entomophilum]|uniref:Lipoprotein n=1 Tax=Mesoplasma entomophilum TaxID=2149 RepID=A0A3S5Y090_9MOLU|nr:BspA family leucine-rich repeat surface protein [Mesoplasma entomophilum]ATQ35481.1 hypothetical protein CS528_01730 [Mesoplasma entomophilum]ATZ19441.1 hypothetical protein MENTO_v1c03350 [Mesoplasma entomophilum]